MPLNRTPPPTSPLPMTSTESLASVQGPSHDVLLQLSSSVPDVSQIAVTNVTDRKTNKKQKYESGKETVPVTLTTSTFDAFSDKQEKRFEDLMGKISSIIQQNMDLMHSVEVMSSKYDKFLKRISILEAERRDDKKTIQQLEEKLELLERKSRSCGIEIRNIPKADNETKESLCILVRNMGTSINVEIDDSKINDINIV
ncbi:hypothetical protein PYW08_012938 [Mythimna loreyi]|uniref:Uncharacterized protein n=1 Tax=Mythimna loreyi TaxID=667449 RepID=A0ACC2PYI0_9NEOP|nr:hypothetical protein PYW08_012938 [Mythimna loreyi]